MKPTSSMWAESITRLRFSPLPSRTTTTLPIRSMTGDSPAAFSSSSKYRRRGCS